MNNTPNANRLHIGIFGRRNSGKSSLINALTDQETSIVSQVAGTTTDAVAKAMELHGIGATLIIDTPGFDDDDQHLGDQRVSRARKTTERTDIALLICEDGDLEEEKRWFEVLKSRSIPTIPIINKVDIRGDISELSAKIEMLFSEQPIAISTKPQCADIEHIREEIRVAILRKISPDATERTILEDLVSHGDLVLLVMPQDIQAPKGRLILPQMQTLRELLDRGCIPVSCTTDMLQPTLDTLAKAPRLIVTDSQVFSAVHALKPAESLLTSFSILMAGYKGDISAFVEGVRAIDTLTHTSRILIAEGCTHAPLSEDIGRVKIPRMLRKRVGEALQIDIVAGRDFPADLTPYDLIIHCGGCMFNRKYILSRIEQATQQSTPITNYGVVIAHLSGILPEVVLP
ncbi:MAG: [FeFe] hydrogenase H-cluster maturation GTPase HydF [Rikenellaceae bacterium]